MSVVKNPPGFRLRNATGEIVIRKVRKEPALVAINPLLQRDGARAERPAALFCDGLNP